MHGGDESRKQNFSRRNAEKRTLEERVWIPDDKIMTDIKQTGGEGVGGINLAQIRFSDAILRSKL
jgi:hypothetical protein